MKIKIAVKTDIGKERDKNEDAFIICPDLCHQDWKKNEDCVELESYGTILALADGMGGENAGEVASSLAMASVQKDFSTASLESIITSDEQIRKFIKILIKNADAMIKSEILSHPETRGMGTTIVVCWILEEKTYVAWCGDSRCYVFNPKSGLRALTKDHSYVQELIDKGELTEEEAFSHPDSNIITKGLGDFDDEIFPEIISCPTRIGDVFMLCSDGLCGYCTNKDIERTMRSHISDVSDCCNVLMKMALDSGGYDNICIAMASVDNEKRNAHFASGIRDFFHKLFHF